MTEAKAGSFDQLDAFLAEKSLGIMDMAGLPDEQELFPDLDIHANTVKQERKIRGKRLRTEKKHRRSQQRDGDPEQPDCPEVVEASLSAVPSSTSSVQVVNCCGNSGIGGPAEVSAPTRDSSAEFCGGSLRSEIIEELLRFRPEQFVLSKRFANIREALQSGPGVLDLFSGARGFSRAYVALDASWSLCFDISHRPDENLQDPTLQRKLMKLVRGGAFKALAASPVCASFSTAITPAWRTLLHPGGRPDLLPQQRLKVEHGHCQLRFVLSLVRLCLEQNLLFWVENPDPSWFWRQPGELSWQDIIENPRVGDFRLDQCRFGTPWRKRTRFRTNCSLRNQRVLCRCTSGHVVLRGRCKERKVNFTKLAESYPRKLCKTLAAAFAQDLGAVPGRRLLCIDDCAKCGGLRIGEAANPGPRRPADARHTRSERLEDVDLLEPQTVAMRARFWKSFAGWLQEEVGDAVFETVVSNPLLFVKSLESYGHLEFAAGTPLYYFRQLLAHVQREFPLTKPHMSLAWRVVSKWELLEPVQHRPPIPEPLVLAMCSLAMSWNWPLFAAVTLTCFYGICRIGEVLTAQRGSLLTPVDLLSEDKVLYLKISKPKTRKRGPSVQYSTVSEHAVVGFLVAVWQDCVPKSPLYPSSPSNFRRRWDAILRMLGVQSWRRITPGSLRGGGCVAAHRKGMAIHDLLWKMRLQHTKTLGFYLQETTAESVLPALTKDCRDNIKALRTLLPFQLEEFQRRAPFE